LPLVLLVVGCLLGACAVIVKLAPSAPRFFEAGGDVAVRVEAATGWSYEAVTNYLLVMAILFLLAAQRALSGLTRFFLDVVLLAGWVSRGGRAPDVPRTVPPTRWVWTAVMAWGVSVAVVHVLG
jgi:hypothetical protein